MVPPPSSPAPLFDSVRTQALFYEEALRIRDLLIEHLLAPAAPGASEPAPAGSQEEVLPGLLRRLQVLMLKHPIVVQAAFSALVAEGRRFATTPEGAAWKSTLASSPLLQQGRRLWDALSLNIPEEAPATVLPSAYIEALFQAIASSQLEELLRNSKACRAREMPMPLLDEPGSDFADRNPILPLLLGMLSLSQRFDRLLPEPPAQAPTPASPLPAPEEDGLLMMVLGLVSVRRTFLGSLEASRLAGEAAPPVPAAPDAPAAPSLRELLR